MKEKLIVSPLRQYVYLTHTSLLIYDYCAKNRMIILPHPPYSSDLAPADLFPKLIYPLKEQRFTAIDKIKENLLTTNSRTYFPRLLLLVETLLENCINLAGENF